ncbi:MAG: sialidase family protein [Phycisphaerales bacterium]
MGRKSIPAWIIILTVVVTLNTQTAISRADALCDIKNVVVYEQEGKFCGWPANEGIWSWGDEILVGFEVADYVKLEKEHSIDRGSPKFTYLARSKDGGLNWKVEKPKEILQPSYMENNDANDYKLLKKLKTPMDFTNPNFAMKLRKDVFYYSYSRGEKWEGPFGLPKFGHKLLMARTDYIVLGKNECIAFVASTEDEGGKTGKTFGIKTVDGGMTWKFINWVTNDFPPTQYKKYSRSTMPSTVRVSDTNLITALRQRVEDKQWLDIYASNDMGKTWSFLSKGADNINNPPSLIRLKDGRLCLIYCSRVRPDYGLRAKISEDNGKTWSDEKILRNDGLSWDIGYVRSVQRPDGKVVSVYYYHTKENQRQHIAATLWQP